MKILVFSFHNLAGVVEVNGPRYQVKFSGYDAVTAAIELGYVNQPDDRDQDRIGYEHPAFSATCREVLECSVEYWTNEEILESLTSDQAEAGVARLAEQIINNV